MFTGPNIITNGLNLCFDVANPLSYGVGGSYSLVDLTGALTYSYNVKNLAVPLTSWAVIRSNLSLITDGSITPPFPGAKVWSSTVATGSFVNSLHRIWSDGNLNGVTGSLGNGYYRYYMWVRGKSTNSANASLEIDISDGNTYPAVVGQVTIATNSNWQLLSAWDNISSSYNSSKFFDFSYQANGIGTDGDVYYISGITIARFDTTAANLTPLYSFPGYIDYGASIPIRYQASLINSPSYSSQNGGSISFDGVNDYIIFDGGGINDSSGSISVWVKVTATGSNKFIFYSVGTTTNRYYIRQTSNYNFDAVRGTSSNYSSTFGTLTASSWFNMVLTWDSLNLYTYVNGSYVGSASYIGAGTSASNTSYLGNSSAVTDAFAGNISSLMTYSRKLSLSEILQNYNGSKSRYGLF